MSRILRSTKGLGIDSGVVGTQRWKPIGGGFGLGGAIGVQARQVAGVGGDR